MNKKCKNTEGWSLVGEIIGGLCLVGQVIILTIIAGCLS